jgi:hypothetical protein
MQDDLSLDQHDALAQALYARAACFAAGVAIPPDLLLATLDPHEAAHAALDRLVALGQLERDSQDMLRFPVEQMMPVEEAIPNADARAAVARTLLETGERADCGDG